MKIRFLALAAFLAACQNPPPAPTPQGGVIVHLFEWRWEDVARECEEFLGPNGYAAVQVSPPSENMILGGRPWYERYGPVSYRIESRSGTRAQFADMTARCSASGVEVIADVIVNHMTAADQSDPNVVFTGVGVAGSTGSRLDYPGIYTQADFHRCPETEDHNIQDWNDPVQLRNCELVDLSDLATETEHVRATIGAYLADLVSLGVKGFRIDAAKHVPPADLAAMLSFVPDDIWIVQEVGTGGTYLDWMQEYEANGNLTEFSYTEAMGELLRQRSWADFAPDGWFWTSRQYIPSDKALVFVDNHDRQRGHGGAAAINYKDGSLYQLAQVATLAWPYGRKRVMSSFAFETDYQGPPMDADEATIPVYSEDELNCGKGEWVCEHRWPTTVGAVGFHNAVQGEDEVTDWWTDGAEAIAFGRGSAGFVVINGGQETVEHVWHTSLPAGAYCNRLVEGVCQEVNVSDDGSLQARLGPMTALMIDSGFRPPD